MKTFTKVVVPNLYRNKEYYAARKWCANTVGVSDSRAAKDPGRPWYAKRQWTYMLAPSGFSNHLQESSFYFRNPADATMFQLVWAKEFRQT
jgi:hypothetical protein